MASLDKALSNGEGKLAERAEKSIEKLFFKTVEVDLPQS
jgi:hypothetical protein